MGIVVIGFLLLLGALVLYRALKPEPERYIEQPLVQLRKEEIPRFIDDLQGERLKKAIARQMETFEKKDPHQLVVWGREEIPQARIAETLRLFYDLLERKGLENLEREIPEHFTVYQASGRTNAGDVLFTGYYEPILEARRWPDEEYIYPLFGLPEDMQVLNLGLFNPAYEGDFIALRVQEGRIKPYFDREAIDTDQALSGKGLELFYLNDYVDRFMLHVQGSGILRLKNGETVRVGFAGTNRYPYVSVGKELLADNVISPENMSLQAIRNYFREHPEQAADYFNRNRRYVFFREYSGTVQGSVGAPLTAGRSIATDKALFPGGGLAFIVTRTRDCDQPGAPVVPLSRFVVDQDTGSAIKGPGRVDLFWGTGDEAGKRAGCFTEQGQLYYLLAKE